MQEVTRPDTLDMPQPPAARIKLAIFVDLKNCTGSLRSILMPPTSHIASLNRHTPKFSGVGLKLTWCQPFGVQGLTKSDDDGDLIMMIVMSAAPIYRGLC